MSNYVYNKIICTKEVLEKYLLDYYPISKEERVKSAYITFNKLFNVNGLNEYSYKEYGADPEPSHEFIYKEISENCYEVKFCTKWYYPIKAIIRLLETCKDAVEWYAVEENKIYISKFTWNNNKIKEEVFELDEAFDEYTINYMDYTDETEDYETPDNMVWYFNFNENGKWIEWKYNSIEELIERYFENRAYEDFEKMKKENENNIPEPSVKEVEKYLKKWDGLENYVLQEKSLNKLFHKTYPENKEIEEILIKASCLNDFYSTNIFRVFPVAKHILKLDIDERLRQGDLKLVNDIANVEIKGKSKRFYSFATKYCSHHYPELYPIYDSYVKKMLLYFRKKDGFADFANEDLKNYTKFYNILEKFAKYYGLEKYNMKYLDRYLWQLGKDYKPNNY